MGETASGLVVEVRTGRVGLPPFTAEGVVHYTSVEALLGMIESRQLWLSSSRALNDTHEGRWLKNRLAALLGDPAEWDPWLRENWDRLFSASDLSYLACFSSRWDLLSQWRAYSADGTGVAIGINPTAMRVSVDLPAVILDPQGIWSEEPRFVLRQVQYLTDDDIRDLLYEEVAYAVDNRDDGADFRLRHALTQLSLVVKNPAFAEEQELRIFHTPDESQPPVEVHFRHSSGRLVSYVKLDVDDAAFRSVMLGPRCAVEESELQRLFDREGLEVAISRSEATYRN